MTDNKAGVPLAAVDFTTPEFARNPIGGYETLRRQGPIVWLPTSRAYFVTGYRDSFDVLRDTRLVQPDLGSNWRKLADKLGRDYAAMITLFSYIPVVHEGPHHAWLRRILAVAVAPYAMGHPAIHAHLEKTFAHIRRTGRFDLASDLAGFLLFDIMCDLMELPQRVREAVRPVAKFSEVFNPVLSTRKRDVFAAGVEHAVSAIAAYVSQEADLERDNLLTKLINAIPADVDDKGETAANLIVVMLVMGNDALGSCVTFSVNRLLSGQGGGSEPAQCDWGEISDDAIRWAAPVDFLTRVATQDVEVAGVPIGKDGRITVSPICANHDPVEFGPLAGSITAKPGNSTGLAFAMGAHVCVGNRFSRTIVKSTFEGLASLPRLRLAGDIVYGEGRNIRTYESLPLEFESGK